MLAGMVVRKRLRAVLFPLTLYACSGLASFYFLETAMNGERGLKTKDEFRRQNAALRVDLNRLKEDRAQWQHRIDLMRSEAIDGDLLDEQVRTTLGYVDPRDLVIFTRPR